MPGITLAFQQRTTDKSHQFARREKLRQERLDAYSLYAGALINYRRCLPSNSVQTSSVTQLRPTWQNCAS